MCARVVSQLNITLYACTSIQDQAGKVAHPFSNKTPKQRSSEKHLVYIVKTHILLSCLDSLLAAAMTNVYR